MVGSLYYTSQLPEADRDKIKFYFNYDMIGSPNPNFVVSADNEAHKYGAQPIFDYLERNGVSPQFGYVVISLQDRRRLTYPTQ